MSSLHLQVFVIDGSEGRSLGHKAVRLLMKQGRSVCDAMQGRGKWAAKEELLCRKAKPASSAAK